MTNEKRVVSGNRPTGKLHWGNYFGALKNWIDLQEKYDCFYFIADWHALTTGYEHPEEISPSVIDVLKDWFACGLDPKKSTVFIQSWVPEHAELHVLLSMITPLGWLERVPSFKDMQQQLSDRDLNMYGFLGYPLLQTADVIIYNAHFVPVGEDQVAHIEFSREIVRRFHFLMKKENVFVEPKPLLTRAARVPGTDGRKMSKSFNNAIYIADDDATVSRKLMDTITDPARKKRTDLGHPEVCNIFAYHKLFTKPDEVEDVTAKCKSAGIGCVECKKRCIENALAFWRPLKEKRAQWDGKEDKLLEIASDGSKKARVLAQKTMETVREVMGLKYE